MTMTYIQPIFTPDSRYQVKKTFKSGPTSTFNAGDVVVFERDAYSPYDNSFVYVFRAESNGEIKEWWLLEGQSKELWREYFGPVSGEL
jgi:hypothetical protein